MSNHLRSWYFQPMLKYTTAIGLIINMYYILQRKIDKRRTTLLSAFYFFSIFRLEFLFHCLFDEFQVGEEANAYRRGLQCHIIVSPGDHINRHVPVTALQ
jgi:uncharacterized membrane protein YozB (DUF420 family)